MKNKKLLGIALCTLVFSTSSTVEASNANSVYAGATAIISSYLSLSEGISIQPEEPAAEEVQEEIPLIELAAYVPEEIELVELTAPIEEEPEETDTYGYTVLGIANVDNFLNVREDAGTGAKLVGKMPEGAGCEVLEELDGWYLVKSGNVKGYVSADYLLTGDAAKELAEKYVKPIATVTTETLRVREEPNTDCKITTLVPEGEELTVVEDMGDWIKIELDDSEVYVASEFVEISLQLPHASTIKELNYGNGVSDKRVDLVQYALQFVGNRYVWGGTSLTNGVDCSGFTMKVYAKYGVSLPHSSRSQSGMGKRVTSSSIQPGDLVFYGSGSRVSHVAIYIGNGQIVHASNSRDGIKISNMYYRTPLAMRSFL